MILSSMALPGRVMLGNPFAVFPDRSRWTCRPWLPRWATPSNWSGCRPASAAPPHLAAAVVPPTPSVVAWRKGFLRLWITQLAAQLGARRALLRLPRKRTPHHLHNQPDRGAELELRRAVRTRGHCRSRAWPKVATPLIDELPKPPTTPKAALTDDHPRPTPKTPPY